MVRYSISLKLLHMTDFLAKSPDGESPAEVEARAVPALYDSILNTSGSVFVFVGKWLLSH
jgi:hypothetical protein